MRTPTRKPGKHTFDKVDYNITQEKYNKYSFELDRLLNVKRPPAIVEVKRLALMGDFSENAAYSIAKGRLRGMNYRITELEKLLKRAVIIETNRNINQVQLGSFVTVKVNNKEKTYQILGSAEVDPENNIISHNSPLGNLLMGGSIGMSLILKIRERGIIYKIIDIR